MFEIGFSELVIVAVIALIVLGPERLPRAAQMVGLWVRKARAQWYSMKAELERDLAADELKRSLRDSGRAIERDLRATADDARQTFSQVTDATDTNTIKSKPAESESQDASRSDSLDDAPDTQHSNDKSSPS